MAVAEKVFNNGKSPEEKQLKASNWQTCNLVKTLLDSTMGDIKERK